mgnify:FL=1
MSLKISYINEIATLCELTGCDIHDIVAGMSLDERIGDQFLRAGIGYGGSCFEKDAKALCHIAQENGYHLKTVEAGLKVNNEQKTHMLMKAIQCVNLNNLKVAVLGLTFKPETDDVRNAPSLDNVKRLLDLGSHIVAYDPVGVSSFMKHFPEGEYGKGSIRYKQSAEEALTDADICFIFTEWQEFKELDPSIFIKRMKCPRVFDGRNIYMKKKMIDLGIKYYSVGN